MKGNNLSLSFKVLVTTLFLVPLVMFATLICANADPNNENESVISTVVNNVIKSINENSADVIPGIAIKNSQGQDAEENTDFKLLYDESAPTVVSQIQILTDNLTIVGTSGADAVDVGFWTLSAVKNLTLQGVNINYTKDHNALRVSLPSTPETSANDNLFNLYIKGECYIYQSCEQDYNRAINFESGDSAGNINIQSPSATEYSYLELNSKASDTLMSHTTPITFGGKLESLIYNVGNGGDAIDWEVENTGGNNLTVTDNVKLYVGNDSVNSETAIVAGNISVLGSSSLYAVNYNKDQRDMPAVLAKNNFVIDTTGNVAIDAYNDGSWQAIRVQGDMTINKCAKFAAIAQDYSALDVEGTLTINTPNVYICGQFDKPERAEAKRGAFVLYDDTKLKLAPGLVMYGSNTHLVEPETITNRAVLTFTGGSNPDLYTPAVLDGNFASKLAKSVFIRSGEIHDIVFVPGQKATYADAGYKDCYKDSSSDAYFEDFEGTIPIDNYQTWKTSGNGYLEPLKIVFDPYREEVKTNCDALIQMGDTPEIQALIENAKSQVDAYVYNDTLPLASNEALLDAIYYQLVTDINNLMPQPIPVPGGGGTVNSASYGGVQTGDNIAIAIGLILAIAACTSVIVLVRRKYSD